MTIAKQKADLQKIQDTIAAGAAKMGAVAVNPDLRPEAKQAHIATIRKEVVAQLDTINAEMAKRQAAAKEGLEFWTQDARRRRALGELDATERLAFFETLKRSSTAELVAHLKDAAREKSAGRAEAVRLEFHTRNDRRTETRDLALEFNQILDRLDDPQTANEHAECSQTDGLAELAQVLVREFTRGASNPAERMAAARLAGLVAPPPAPMDPAERAAGLAA